MPRFSWKVRMSNRVYLIPAVSLAPLCRVLGCRWNELKLSVTQVAGLRSQFLALLLEPHPLENTLLFSRKTLTYSGHGASAYHCKVPVCEAVPAADRYWVEDNFLG